MKASPLLRAWLARLAAQGVRFALRREWTGWDADGRLAFRRPDGESEIAAPDATVLALGGASWPRLGADGGWVDDPAARGTSRLRRYAPPIAVSRSPGASRSGSASPARR